MQYSVIFKFVCLEGETRGSPLADGESVVVGVEYYVAVTKEVPFRDRHV